MKFIDHFLRPAALICALLATLVATLLFIPVSVHSSDLYPTAQSLVGVWQARLQPDDKKIERMLKERGYSYMARLFLIPQITKALNSTILTVTFNADGSFQMKKLGGNNKSVKIGDRQSDNGRWKLIKNANGNIAIQILRQVNKKAVHENNRSISAGMKQKTLHFTFLGQNQLASDDHDWADAPFTSPKFVRTRTFRK